MILQISALGALEAGCPGNTGETATDSATDGATTGATDTPTTTEGGPFAGVIASTVRTYWPLGEAPQEHAYDPLSFYMTMEIAAGEAPDIELFPAAYDGSSRLEFADVPEVTYRLRRQYPPYPLLPSLPGSLAVVETAAREVGLFAGTFSGRPDVALTWDPATQVEVSATNMQPLGLADRFELYSYNADAQTYLSPSFDPLDGSNSPEEGATALKQWTTPWRPSTGRSQWTLVDPAKGDDLWLTHLASGPLVPDPSEEQLQDAWSYAQTTTLTEIAQMKSGTMVAGATTAVSGSFEPVAGHSFALDLRLSEFLAELDPESAALTSATCFVEAVLEPGIEHPIIGMIPSLGGIMVSSQDIAVDPLCPPDNCDTVHVFPGDRVVDLTTGNPFQHGTEMVQVTCNLYAFVPDTLSGDYDYLISSLAVAGRRADLAKAPIIPRMGLVGDIRVDGVPIPPDEVLTAVGTTPTITFSPPAFGEVDHYRVVVGTLKDTVNTDGINIRRSTVGSVTTENTTVKLPLGLLTPGTPYYLQIVAEHGQNMIETDAYTFDFYSSRAVTGIIYP